MSADWIGIVRTVVEWIDAHRAEHLDTDDKGRALMPSFDDLGPIDEFAQARKLFHAACLADPRIAKALEAACSVVPEPHATMLRELVELAKGS